MQEINLLSITVALEQLSVSP